MKKLRGKKRYYRKLFARATNYRLKLTEDSWFDMWHTHLDWLGIGDRGMKPRKQHILALFELHTNLCTQLQLFSKPYQIWITIHKKDSGQDAVFVHSPNENRNEFPYKFSHVTWNCSVPQLLEGIYNVNEFDIGYYGSTDNDEMIYFLCLKSDGTYCKRSNIKS